MQGTGKKRVKKGNGREKEREIRRGEEEGERVRERERGPPERARRVLRLDLQNKRPAGPDPADQWRSTLIPTRDTR